MKRQRAVLFHCCFWLLTACVIAEPLLRAHDFTGLFRWILLFLVFLVSYYVNYLYLLPQWIQARRWALLLFGWLFLLFTDTVIYTGINHLYGITYAATIQGNLWYGLWYSTWLLVMLMALGIAWRFTEEWSRREGVQEQIENLQLKTELSFLKAQLNPHFLFNTLNSIYVLAYRQSAATADAVMKLSDMMHYMMDDSRRERVLLSREVQYIQQLIALQRLRVHGEMSCSFITEGEIDRYTIAPLLLAPFVENIFSHAVLNDKNDPVWIHLKIEDDILYFKTRNAINTTLRELSPETDTIHPQRLELLYSGRYTYSVGVEKGHSTITLIIRL
ncbi:MAG TPA: histidine kinase [Chitinophaga sp.]|uniref:sensor histidine kinase n=1 Tax=Chitinophaga sp. TaxID=1869181 RepID=UPI002B8FB62F|nr:histidine kinase [Chitinophaga sp.]HVI45770.1 histidine kinase [Chitinophaga sp.]